MRKITDLSSEEFHHIFYNPAVRVIRIPVPTGKLKELGNAQRIRLDSLEDFEQLPDVNLVWYKNKNNDSVFWDAPGAINLTVRDAALMFKTMPSWFEKGKTDSLADLLNHYKNGQAEKIEIVTIFDSSLGEVVIVDGVRRAIILYYLYLEDRAVLTKLISSVEISIVEFESTVGWFLCPCDFMPLYFNKKRSQIIFAER